MKITKKTNPKKPNNSLTRYLEIVSYAHTDYKKTKIEMRERMVKSDIYCHLTFTNSQTYCVCKSHFDSKGDKHNFNN